jgi:hypothetical protein
LARPNNRLQRPHRLGRTEKWRPCPKPWRKRRLWRRDGKSPLSSEQQLNRTDDVIPNRRVAAVRNLLVHPILHKSRFLTGLSDQFGNDIVALGRFVGAFARDDSIIPQLPSPRPPA